MRASRLLSIALQLQLRARVTAESLAESFGVSVRTVYRDIDALGAAGIPVYAERGPGGGFRLVDGYRTSLAGLTPREAEAVFLVGLPTAARHLGLGDESAGLGRKLLASMPGPSAALASRLNARFHVDPADWYRGDEPPRHLPALTRAVLDSRAVRMTYESWREVRSREVDPLGLVLKAGAWYLVGRAGARTLTFRVGGIRELAVLERGFAWPADFDLAAWWRESLARFERDLRPAVATIRASAEGRRRLAEIGRYAAQAVDAATAPDRRGWSTVRLPYENDDQGARLLMSLGGEAEALSPASLRRAVAALARTMASRHRARRG